MLRILTRGAGPAVTAVLFRRRPLDCFSLNRFFIRKHDPAIFTSSCCPQLQKPELEPVKNSMHTHTCMCTRAHTPADQLIWLSPTHTLTVLPFIFNFRNLTHTHICCYISAHDVRGAVCGIKQNTEHFHSVT